MAKALAKVMSKRAYNRLAKKLTRQEQIGQKLEVKNCAECNGSGCAACNSTGYGKRLLRYELLKTK
jgi:type II secretory ATPase GspE/PulE/Tfp pilus assembly ATPase PilB-like protein